MNTLPPETAREVLRLNAHKIPWDNPETIVVDELLIGNVERKITFRELLCIAYNLKPNE